MRCGKLIRHAASVAQAVFVTNRHSGMVYVFDLRTHAGTAKIPVGANPHGIAMQP